MFTDLGDLGFGHSLDIGASKFAQKNNAFGLNDIVARTLRVRSLRHTECADYYRVRYFRPLA